MLDLCYNPCYKNAFGCADGKITAAARFFHCQLPSDVAFIRLVQIVELAQNGLKMEIN